MSRCELRLWRNMPRADHVPRLTYLGRLRVLHEQFLNHAMRERAKLTAEDWWTTPRVELV